MSVGRASHILVVDDDSEIRDLLSRFLVLQGFRVSGARDGREMRKAIEDRRIDLVVLDLMLPGEHGLTLCRNIRAVSTVPIIMLTAMVDETDRIIGLEMGADDYLAKPFHPRELLARIRAVLRRADLNRAFRPLSEVSTRVRFAGWTLVIPQRHLESPEGVIVNLSGAEFDLLSTFAERPGRILTREQLLEVARGRSPRLFDRSIDVQVSRLRRKIERDPRMPTLIKTVRGGGYVFTPDVEQA